MLGRTPRRRSPDGLRDIAPRPLDCTTADNAGIVPCVPEQEDVMLDAERIDELVGLLDPEGTNLPLRAWADATKGEERWGAAEAQALHETLTRAAERRAAEGRAVDPFDPRAATLAHAYAAACAANMNRGEGRVVWEDEAVQAVAAGLVYVGDQIGRLVPERGLLDAAATVDVVLMMARDGLAQFTAGERVYRVAVGQKFRMVVGYDEQTGMGRVDVRAGE